MQDFHSPCERAGIGAGRLLLSLLIFAESAQAADALPRFRLTYSQDIHAGPFTGRVYLFFWSRDVPRPPGVNWFRPPPFVAKDVADWHPGEPLDVEISDEGLLTFPRRFESAHLAGTHVQAIARFNPLDRVVTAGAGNGFSATAPFSSQNNSISLHIDRRNPQREFRESEWTKELVVRSRLLSEFHGREVQLRAAVTLPRSYYEHPQRRYPTIFSVPGFGGTHHPRRPRTAPVNETNERGVEFLRVTLDPSCPLGHHVFADSANNGPVGTALLTELIPAFDKQFRSIAGPRARFLTGHSSGGWSSLWLQITYPETFGGTWSTAPDPVDFRDYQKINLYRPGENMYVDPDGRRRPLARRGEQVALWYDDFAWMEHVLGSGGQLHSFEAVFSPRGPDGKPLLLWDRESGVINSDVAHSWEKYDIRLQLERNWQNLQPRLSGKLHVFMGEEDTFLLEGATILLKESLARLGSDAVIEIHPGKDHGTLMTRDLRDRIRREMTETFLNHFPDWPQIGPTE